MSTQFSFDHLFSGTPSAPPLTAEECLPPRSRNTDVASSHRAEAAAKRSGVMRGQRMIALSLVEKYPGKTAAELAQFHAPLDAAEQFKTMIWLRKRLPELREMKLVRTTQIGSGDLMWWPKKTE